MKNITLAYKARWAIRRFVRNYRLGVGGVALLMFLRKESYLRQVGWFRSFRHRAAIDGNGQPIPWLTYSAIAFLSARVKPEFTVLEYGSGNSTLWWAARVRYITSVEHKKKWADRLASNLPSNARLIYRDSARYCEDLEGPFDVVVIDGTQRVECARQAIRYLNEGGVVIFDNSDWREHADGIRYLCDHGFKQLEFFGLAPITVKTMATSIFYRTQNCLDI